MVTLVVFLSVMSKDFGYVSDGGLLGVAILAILKITGIFFYIDKIS